MRFDCLAKSATLSLALVASLAVTAGGCGYGFLKPAKLDSESSPDGKFRAELERTDSSPLVGHFDYSVFLYKVRPSWKDYLTLNRSSNLCELDGGGYLSVDWVDSSHLSVTCWDCKKGLLGLFSEKEWEGVSVEYKYSETPPHPEPETPGVWRLNK
jgi:hypothetical protein